MQTKKPVRIAQIIGKMWAGGVEAVVFNYYRALDHNEVQFDFYYDADSTVEPPADIIAMGARFYKLTPYQRIWKYIPELRSLLKKNDYKIVHSHLNTLSVFTLFAAWSVGVPVRIAHNHSVPCGNEWKRNAAKVILKQFSKIFATDYFSCSEKAGRWLFGDKSFENGEVTVVKNALDFGKFKCQDEEKLEISKELGLNNNVVIGHVGRFTFAKNHVKLLEIFAEIMKLRPSAVLLLVGDGELYDEIEAKIRELNLQNRVLMVGKVSNPEKYYSVMDVVVLPSVFEGFSMTTIEAQISGVPLVISKAVPEEAIISDGCRYLNVDDSNKEWAEAAIALIGKSVNLLNTSQLFDVNLCAKNLEHWYKNRI